MQEQKSPSILCRFASIFLTTRAVLVEFVSVAASVSGLWTIYSQSVPSVLPYDVGATSSPYLQFVVTNNGWLPMNDVWLECFVPSVITGNDRQTVFQGFVRIASVTPAVSIAARHQINWNCDPSSLIKIGKDGIVIGGAFVATIPGLSTEPMHVLSIETVIKVYYTTFGVSREWGSQRMEWSLSAQSGHWTIGPTIR